MANRRFGVWIANLSDRTVVGGTEPGSGNSIFHNGEAGVAESNVFSTNSILGNSIDLNGSATYQPGVKGGLGIDLPGLQSFNPNDPGDGDTHAASPAHDLPNFPLINSVATAGAGLLVTAQLDTRPTRRTASSCSRVPRATRLAMARDARSSVPRTSRPTP